MILAVRALRAALPVLLLLLLPALAWANPMKDATEGLKALERKDYEKGIELITKAIESGKLSEQNLLIAYFNRGNAWLHLGAQDKAMTDLNQALSRNATFAEALLKRGQIWKDKGDYDKALEDLNAAVSLAPANPRGYFLRGLTWSLHGNATQAMEDFAEASRLDPRFIISPLLEAVMAVGDEFGVKFMTKAIESDKLGPVNLALTYYHRGRAWMSLGSQEKALDDFTNAIVHDPALAPAYAARADAWKVKEDFAQAVADYSKAINLKPGNATLHYNRGYALSLAGQQEEAMRDFQTALQMDPSLEMPDMKALKDHQSQHRQDPSVVVDQD